MLSTSHLYFRHQRYDSRVHSNTARVMASHAHDAQPLRAVIRPRNLRDRHCLTDTTRSANHPALLKWQRIRMVEFLLMQASSKHSRHKIMRRSVCLHAGIVLEGQTLISIQSSTWGSVFVDIMHSLDRHFGTSQRSANPRHLRERGNFSKILMGRKRK